MTSQTRILATQFVHARSSAYLKIFSLDSSHKMVLLQQPWSHPEFVSDKIRLVVIDHERAAPSTAIVNSFQFVMMFQSIICRHLPRLLVASHSPQRRSYQYSLGGIPDGNHTAMVFCNLDDHLSFYTTDINYFNMMAE